MTRLYFFLTAISLCVLTSSCRKKSGDNGGIDGVQQATVADLTKMLNVQEEAILKYEESWKATHDTLTAIFDMGQWLLRQPEVAEVYLLDDLHLSIFFKSGLQSNITVAMIGAQGQYLTRDGSGGYAEGNIRTYTLGGSGQLTRSDNTISNKKVLVMLTSESEFYKGGYPFLPLFDKSKTKLDVTLVTNKAATLKVFKTIGDYGFIILNTHGGPDGNLLLYSGIPELDIPKHPTVGIWTEADVSKYITQSGDDLLNSLLNGKIIMGSFAMVDLFNASAPVLANRAIYVTDKYISDMNGKLKDAVVFGNFCYSGNTVSQILNGTTLGNMPDAWMKAGAAAYYGYAFAAGGSTKVDNNFCVDMEDSLINNLVINGDSTGIAHLAGDETLQGYKQNYIVSRSGSSGPMGLVFQPSKPDSLYYTRIGKLYFTLFHSPKYKYGCGMFTDKRDNQKYHTVCIGDHRWFAENLRYNAAGSLFAHNDPSTIKEYGKLYNYPTASAGQGSTQGNATIQGICPTGWHIPNKLEWENLVSALDAADFEELAVMLQSNSPLWLNDPEIGNKKRNISDFSALPAGNAYKTSVPIGYNNSDAAFILSTKNDGIISPEGVYSVIIKQATKGGQRASVVATGGQWVNPSATPTGDTYYSCRCVQNK